MQTGTTWTPMAMPVNQAVVPRMVFIPVPVGQSMIAAPYSCAPASCPPGRVVPQQQEPSAERADALPLALAGELTSAASIEHCDPEDSDEDGDDCSDEEDVEEDEED